MRLCMYGYAVRLFIVSALRQKGWGETVGNCGLLQWTRNPKASTLKPTL